MVAPARPAATIFFFMLKRIGSLVSFDLGCLPTGVGFATRSPQTRRPVSACGSQLRPQEVHPIPGEPSRSKRKLPQTHASPYRFTTANQHAEWSNTAGYPEY